MRIEVLAQSPYSPGTRVGDALNAMFASPGVTSARFAVAYARMSGLRRIAGSLDVLRSTGGTISAAVGIDGGVTSSEALKEIYRVSDTSTVVYPNSSFIFHPKVYISESSYSATVVVGSNNLTVNGLYRNIEAASTVSLDLSLREDCEVLAKYQAILDPMLDVGLAGVQGLSIHLIDQLMAASAIPSEARSADPDTTKPASARAPRSTALDLLFPRSAAPSAPPPGSIPPVAAPSLTLPPATVGIAQTFMMLLSAFDSSHRTGVKGTPEVIVPHGAIGFFPQLAGGTSLYPEAKFDVAIQAPLGSVISNFRLWYYEFRATGTKIDEYRLRMNHLTVDLTTPGGGDLLVVSKTLGAIPQYEVAVLTPADPTFPAFRRLCIEESQGKVWGLV